jgi:hypothetical protein
MTGNQFPKLSAKNLEGRAMEIPEDLTGAANLVVLAFLREHQGPVETWLPHLAELEREFAGLEVWEVAALSRRYRIWRGAIDSGMRAGVADPLARRRTLTTYLDLRDLHLPLGLRDFNSIHLYLLDRSGEMLWEGQGSYDPASVPSLRTALEREFGDRADRQATST